jgi:hypothetical protein
LSSASSQNASVRHESASPKKQKRPGSSAPGRFQFVVATTLTRLLQESQLSFFGHPTRMPDRRFRLLPERISTSNVPFTSCFDASRELLEFAFLTSPFSTLLAHDTAVMLTWTRNVCFNIRPLAPALSPRKPCLWIYFCIDLLFRLFIPALREYRPANKRFFFSIQ